MAWKKVKLCQFAKIYSGTDYKKNKKGEEYPIYGTGGIMGYTGDYLNEGPAVLTGRKGTIDKPIYVEGKFWNVDTIFCVKPFDNTDIKFFYYALCNKNLTILNEATGVPSVSSDNLYKLTFEIPVDITEQKRIAKILSTCDEVIFNTQKIIKKYKAVKQGLMQDLFSRGLTEDGKLRPSYKEAPELYKQSELGVIPKDWEVDTLANVTTYVDYRGKTPFKTSNGIQLITAKNVKEGDIDYNISKEYIEEDKYNSVMLRGLPRIGDVLFTTEAPVGNVAQIDKEEIALAQRIIKYRGNLEKIYNKFLLYSFLSDYFRKILLSESTGSTAQGIKGSRLHQLKIKIPSFKEQQAISKRLSNIDSLIQKEEALLSKYRKIKDGLMDKLLTN